MPAKWVVHAKGGPNRSTFEIAVIRDDNVHGKRSYGWFDQNKLLISHNGGPCDWPVIGLVWSQLIKVADTVARELNEAEGGQLEQASHLRMSPENDQPQVLIPDGENEFGIEPGFRDVVKLLRDNADKPEVVRYIAGMLEL